MPEYFDTRYELHGPEPAPPARATPASLLRDLTAWFWLPFARREPDIDLLYFGRVDGRWCEGFAVNGEPHYFRDGYRVRA